MHVASNLGFMTNPQENQKLGLHTIRFLLGSISRDGVVAQTFRL